MVGLLLVLGKIGLLFLWVGAGECCWTRVVGSSARAFWWDGLLGARLCVAGDLHDWHPGEGWASGGVRGS